MSEKEILEKALEFETALCEFGHQMYLQGEAGYGYADKEFDKVFELFKKTLESKS